MICPNCRSSNDDAANLCFTCGKVLPGRTVIRKGSVVASRYEVLETLGKGGMGTVYKAHDKVLDEDVALKILRADIAADPDMTRRFRQEIKLARKVRHRNTCGIHEYGEDGPLRYIAMEFIDGVDMRHVLKQKGAPPAAEAFEIAIQVGEGLHAIHEAGIIHRDLKTPNIMRDSKGVVRLMDFGIAKQAGTEASMGATAIGMIVGTPEYMSPEQARGDKVDFRSDIYALGIVVYEIFTGTVPFRGETPIATIFKQLQEPPPFEGPQAAALPGPLVTVLGKALAKSVDERYATAAEMVAALRGARDEAASRPAPRPDLEATVVGALAVVPDAPPGPSPSTPVPTAVPTAVRTAVGHAPSAEAQEIRSKTAVERERRARERVQALKEACDGIEAALGQGALDEAGAIFARASEMLGDTDPLPAYGARIEVARRRAAVHQLLTEAGVELAAHRWDGAERLGRQAQEQDPSSIEARALLERVAVAREREADEARRRLADEARQRAEEQRRRAEEEQRRKADEARLRDEAIRRSEALKAAIQDIETRLARGDLEGAGVALTQAGQAYGETGAFKGLQLRLEEMRARAEVAQRDQAVSEATQIIERQLRKGDLEATGAALVRARETLGDAAAFDGLETRLEEAKSHAAEEARQRAEEEKRRAEEARARAEAAKRDRAISEATQVIERQLRQGDLEATGAALVRARETLGDAAAFQGLETRLEEAKGRAAAEARRRAEEEKRRAEQAQARAEEERSRAEALGASVASIEALVARGDFDGAKRSLAEAQRAHGNVAALSGQGVRIEAARRQAGEAALQQLLDRVDTLAATQRFDEAIQAVREALQRDPNHAAAKKRLASLEQQKKAQELARAVESIEMLLSRGHVDQAGAELLKAEKAFGKVDALKKHRKGLQEALKKGSGVASAERTEVQPRPARVVAAPGPAVPARRPLGLYVGLGIVAVALVGAGIAWRLVGREGPSPVPSVGPGDTSPEPVASVQPTPSPIVTPNVAPPSGSGLVVVDALPWGEVTEVVDTRGKRHPLGDSPFTPMVLSLPPGDYRISVKNPGAPNAVTLAVTVRDGAVERKVAEFKRIDADQYLKKAGF